MLARLRKIWALHPILSVVFLVALTVVATFTIRTIRHAIYWADPAHQFQPIEAWMPPNYVGMSYNIAPQTLASALNLDPSDKARTIGEIANELSMSLDELQAVINALANSGEALR